MRTFDKRNFVDLESFLQCYVIAPIEESLDTFLRIYENTICDYMRSRNFQNLNDSSKTFLRAIRFLRHYKCHIRHKHISDRNNRRVLYEEILGLMASILQVIMNVHQLSAYDKRFLREMYLGTITPGFLIESQSLDKDFVYKLPQEFTNGTIIKEDFFPQGSKEDFTSSEVQNEARQLVIDGLLELYEGNLKAKFKTASHEAAVKKLQGAGAQASSQSSNYG